MRTVHFNEFSGVKANPSSPLVKEGPINQAIEKLSTSPILQMRIAKVEKSLIVSEAYTNSFRFLLRIVKCVEETVFDLSRLIAIRIVDQWILDVK